MWSFAFLPTFCFCFVSSTCSLSLLRQSRIFSRLIFSFLLPFQTTRYSTFFFLSISYNPLSLISAFFVRTLSILFLESLRIPVREKFTLSHSISFLPHSAIIHTFTSFRRRQVFKPVCVNSFYLHRQLQHFVTRKTIVAVAEFHVLWHFDTHQVCVFWETVLKSKSQRCVKYRVFDFSSPITILFLFPNYIMGIGLVTFHPPYKPNEFHRSNKNKADYYYVENGFFKLQNSLGGLLFTLLHVSVIASFYVLFVYRPWNLYFVGKSVHQISQEQRRDTT